MALDQDNWRDVVRLLDIEKRKAGAEGTTLDNKRLADLALRGMEERADPWIDIDDDEKQPPKSGNRVEPMRDHLIVCAAKALLSVGVDPQVERSHGNHYGALVDLLSILCENVPALGPFADPNTEPNPDRETSPNLRFYRRNVIRRARTMYKAEQLRTLG